MRAIILNGTLNKRTDLNLIKEILEKELEDSGWDVESILLREIDIKSCMGCFGCWKKTPGICVIDDPARAINEKIIQSELVVYLTPITFGGWSSEIKKMFDRQLPLLPPGIVLIGGECHHQMRYERYPSIIGIGIAENNNYEDTFKELIRRNSINCYATKYAGGLILYGDKEEAIRNKIMDLIAVVK